MGKQEKSYKVVKQELKDKYEAWKVLAVAGYVNESKEALAKNIIEKVAKEMGFIPSYFATILLTEGLGEAYLNFDYNYTKTNPQTVRNDVIISGFDVAGTDDFGSEYVRYKKYLPPSFNEGFSENDLRTGSEFMKETRTNEHGDSVVSAKFSNMESMIWACGATLAHRRDRFLVAARKFGYGIPSEDELAYWTYVFYQGETRAEKVLDELGSFDIYGTNNGCYPNCNFIKQTRDPNDVALSNLASWRYLQWANIFSE